MRFLIVNADYPEFLEALYGSHPALRDASYDEQLQARYDSLFSVADFYSYNLRSLGHEAWDIYANNEPLQRAWAKEHGLRLPRTRRLTMRLRRGVLPWPAIHADTGWLDTVLVAQIEHLRPDVLINQNIFAVPERPMREARRMVKLMVVQHAATEPPPDRDYSMYDLGLSSYPPTLDRLRVRGVRSVQVHRLGFEPRVLQTIPQHERVYPVTFVGSFHAVHRSRAQWLQDLARVLTVDVWSSTPPPAGVESPGGLRHHGPAWGRAMYEVLASSAIVLNHHGDVGPYANNLRLFEATGMGALLVTDWKENLAEYYDLGTEIVAYRTAEECIERVQYYLKHPAERDTIAAAGQRRTLRCHTWVHRMQELVGLVERYF